MCEGAWGRESDIGYCSAQNKDALGMKKGQSEARIHKDEKRNKDGTGDGSGGKGGPTTPSRHTVTGVIG
jgi:hypothetical protein